MGFLDDVKGFARDVVAIEEKVFDTGIELAFESIVHGSTLTAAPGQPVRTGQLRDSWEIERVSPDVAVLSSDHPAAMDIEEDAEHAHYSNHGPHSVKLTEAGIDPIAAEALRRTEGADG